MRQIPFELDTEQGKVLGFLNVTTGAGSANQLPHHFHVMVQTKRGLFYHGQLMLNPFKGWWLPDSKLEHYAEQLGERVQLWYQ